MTQPSLGAARPASWLPPLPLIGAKFLELRKRRVLMSVTAAFTVATPVIFYGIREISRLSDPARYGPAGSPDAVASVVTLMAQFGFIVAVMFGATAGTTDLTDGMFRHLVITGRSRLALYLARIPAGLAITVPLVALAFAMNCLVTSYESPPPPPLATSVSLNGLSVPEHLDQAGLQSWLQQRSQQAATSGLLRGLGPAATATPA